MAAQTQYVSSLCLPRMHHRVEPSRMQASGRQSYQRRLRCDLSDRLPLRSDGNEQTNTENAVEPIRQVRFWPDHFSNQVINIHNRGLARIP